MKNKYHWDIGSPITIAIILALSNIIVFICANKITNGALFPCIFVSIILFIIDCIIIRGIIAFLRDTSMFEKDTITVTRRYEKPYSFIVRKIKRIYVSMQYIDKLAGRDDKMVLTANDLKGEVLGIGRQMLNAILVIYPHIKVVVLCSVKRLGKQNAILLAKRGYLSEDQLKEVQKRFRLPDGFEKRD